MDPEPSINSVSTVDTNLIFGIIGIFVLLFCTAMIAATEVAFFSLSQKDLNNLGQKNPSKYAIINQLLSKPKKLLATILVANNFLHIAVVILFSFSLDKLFSTITIPVLKFVVEASPQPET